VGGREGGEEMKWGGGGEKWGEAGRLDGKGVGGWRGGREG